MHPKRKPRSYSKDSDPLLEDLPIEFQLEVYKVSNVEIMSIEFMIHNHSLTS